MSKFLKQLKRKCIEAGNYHLAADINEYLLRYEQEVKNINDEDIFVDNIVDVKLDDGFICFHTEDKVYRTPSSEIKKLFNEPRVDKKIYSYISSLKKTFDYIFFK